MQPAIFSFFIAGRDKNGDFWKNNWRGMPPGAVENPDVAQDDQQDDSLKNDQVDDQRPGKVISHAGLNPSPGGSAAPARGAGAAAGAGRRGASRPG